MPALHTKQIKLKLQAVPHWSNRARTILRTFKFEGFVKGIDFVNRIAAKARRTNQHSPPSFPRVQKINYQSVAWLASPPSL